MPDEEVDVSVDLVAPQEHGRYVGYWRLTGPMGRKKWGQRFWTHVHVVDPQAEPQPPTEKEMAEIQAATSDRELDEDAEDPPGGALAGQQRALSEHAGWYQPAEGRAPRLHGLLAEDARPQPRRRHDGRRGGGPR